jgi:hypothetical protein
MVFDYDPMKGEIALLRRYYSAKQHVRAALDEAERAREEARPMYVRPTPSGAKRLRVGRKTPAKQ